MTGARVLLVTNQFPKVSETFIVRQFIGLLERGWDVHLVCRSSDAAQRSFFPETAVAAVAERIHVVGKLTSVVAALRPRIVHYEFGALAPDTIGEVKAPGTATVVSFRGYDLNDARFSAAGHYDAVWTSADAIHVVSEHLWRRALERGCPEDQLHAVIHDAVDAAYFDPGQQEYADVVGSAERPLRILSIGRLHWKKGHEFALEAVRLLTQRGVACEYRIVGEGEHRAAVEYTIEDTGLRNVVQLTGAQPQAAVRDALRWADVMIHAAVTEGFCVSVLEAQSMGLPVVCSDAGGLPENVEDGTTGFVVPRRNPAAMAERLEHLARTPGARQRMGRAARQRVLQRFAFTQLLDAFETLYRQLLALLPPAEPVVRSSASTLALELRLVRLEATIERAERALVPGTDLQR